MKKIAMLFAFVASSLLIVGCEGSTGPQGPPGPTEFPYVMEKTITFNNLNQTWDKISIKHPVELFKGDVILVYIKDIDSNINSPRWYPLPKRFFEKVDGNLEDLEYSYAFTPENIDILVDASTDLINFNGSNTKPSLLRDQVFRIVYISGANPVKKAMGVQSATEKGNTTLSYEEAVRKYNLEDVKVVKNY